MIYSMTGFGKATSEIQDKKITVEIKSLNSKQCDISLRMPSLYKENEVSLRSDVAKLLERGKVELSIQVEKSIKETTTKIDFDLLNSYHKEIVESAKNLGIDPPMDWFNILLKLPDVMTQVPQAVDNEEWVIIKDTVIKAIDELNSFREQEGEMLANILTENINKIDQLLNDIQQFEAERIAKIKAKITSSLEKIEGVSYDTNRFEQEMIYYIEKLDINEEKTRLKNHLDYFIETMKLDKSSGKKLGFITQEIGREINTLGSKSNNYEMQRIVVQMKDELEQIKEQILNIL